MWTTERVSPRIRVATRANAVHAAVDARKVGRDFICRTPTRPASTARYWPSPSRRSARSSPSRSSCSSTPPSSATSAPPRWPVSALASTVLITVVGPLRLPRLRHHGGRRATRSARVTGPARCRSASTACGSPLGLGVVLAAATWLARPVARRRARGLRRGRRAGRHLPALVGARPARACSWSSPRPARCAGCSTPARPLVVAAVGAVVNAVLNVVLVYGVGHGHRRLRPRARRSRSSAMAVALTRRRRPRRARRRARTLRPAAGGILANARAGDAPARPHAVAAARHPADRRGWRRASGAVALAGHQVVGAVWGLAAFALDALAIAAQALVGHALGAADVAPRPRAPAPHAPVGRRRRRRARRSSSAALSWAYVPALHVRRRRPARRRRRARRRRGDHADGRVGVRARRRAHRRRRRPLPRLGRHGHARGLRAVRVPCASAAAAVRPVGGVRGVHAGPAVAAGLRARGRLHGPAPAPSPTGSARPRHRRRSRSTRRHTRRSAPACAHRAGARSAPLPEGTGRCWRSQVRLRRP